MKKMHVLIDEDLHDKLKKIANAKNTTITDFIRFLLEKQLERYDKDIKKLENVLNKIETMEVSIEKINEV